MFFECGFPVGVEPESETYGGSDDGGSAVPDHVCRAESVCTLDIEVDDSSEVELEAGHDADVVFQGAGVRRDYHRTREVGILGVGRAHQYGLLEACLEQGGASHPELYACRNVDVLAGEVDEYSVAAAVCLQELVAGLIGVQGLAEEADYTSYADFDIGSAITSEVQSGGYFRVCLHVCSESASLQADGEFDQLCAGREAECCQYEY